MLPANTLLLMSIKLRLWIEKLSDTQFQIFIQNVIQENSREIFIHALCTLRMNSFVHEMKHAVLQECLEIAQKIITTTRTIRNNTTQNKLDRFHFSSTIIRMIASYLNQSSYYKLSRTNRYNYIACHDTFSLTEMNTTYIPTIIINLHYFSNVKTLRIKWIDFNHLIGINNTRLSIKKLEIAGTNAYPNNRIFNISRDSAWLQNVTTLSIKNILFGKVQDWIAFQTWFPNIRTLNISEIKLALKMYTITKIDPFPMQFLNHLTITKCNDGLVIQLLEASKHMITSLCMMGGNAGIFLQYPLFDKFPKLTILEIQQTYTSLIPAQLTTIEKLQQSTIVFKDRYETSQDRIIQCISTLIKKHDDNSTMIIKDIPFKRFDSIIAGIQFGIYESTNITSLNITLRFNNRGATRININLTLMMFKLSGMIFILTKYTKNIEIKICIHGKINIPNTPYATEMFKKTLPNIICQVGYMSEPINQVSEEGIYFIYKNIDNKNGLSNGQQINEKQAIKMPL